MQSAPTVNYVIPPWNSSGNEGPLRAPSAARAPDNTPSAAARAAEASNNAKKRLRPKGKNESFSEGQKGVVLGKRPISAFGKRPVLALWKTTRFGSVKNAPCYGPPGKKRSVERDPFLLCGRRPIFGLRTTTTFRPSESDPFSLFGERPLYGLRTRATPFWPIPANPQPSPTSQARGECCPIF